MSAPDRIRVAQDAEGFWTCREAVSGSQEYVRADVHEAALTEARAETKQWQADANLMLGFADLAYDVGAYPTSSELIDARNRAIAAIKRQAREDALREAASLAANKWPRGSAHTYASENADRYIALEDASEAITEAILALLDQAPEDQE